MGFHSGLDIAAYRGTPVRAVADGTIMFAGWRGGYGNMILIRHHNGIKTRYAHLKTIRVTVGQEVTQDQIIGNVGNTGNVRKRKGRDGSHLHFEVYIGKKRVNPLIFLR